ncbi:MAG: ABC transporter permease [Candidatus Hodarchaeales archaeon]
MSILKESKKTHGFREKVSSIFVNYDLGSLGTFAIIMLVFSFFMVLPILSISFSAFNWSFDLSNPLSFLDHFLYCFENRTYRNSIYNALFTGLTTTLICSIIGITITVIFSRYRFKGKKFFQVLTILPLVAPPFVGAFAVSRLLRGNGIISNFLQLIVPGLSDLLGKSIWGIIFIQSIHLWPLVFFNTAASYSKIDPAQEEQARNLGSWSINLYRRILLPLITPGFMAGAVLVFIFSISDLGTPIVMNFSEYAPYLAFSDLREQRESYIQAAYAIVIILLIISVLALIFSSKVVGMKDYAVEKVSGMEQTRLMQKPSKRKAFLIYLLLVSILLVSLLPHIGVLIVAFVERIKLGEIIPTLWSLDGLITTYNDPELISMIFNSLFYAGMAMVITVVIGVIAAYLLVRKKNLRGISIIMMIIGCYVGLILGAQIAVSFGSVLEKNLIMFGSMFIMAILFFVIGRTMNLRCLEMFSTIPFAIPGIVLAFGYISFFGSVESLWGILPPELDAIPIAGIITGAIRGFFLSMPNTPLQMRFTNFWMIFVVSYSMRRMPYAVQASTAVLRQVHHSLEEVAYNLGATTRPVTRLAAPLTKGIYDEVTRGNEMTGGILGLIQLLVAAIGMTLTQKLLGEKTGTAFGGG